MLRPKSGKKQSMASSGKKSWSILYLVATEGKKGVDATFKPNAGKVRKGAL